MKNLTLLSLCLSLSIYCVSQKPKITWGEEFKLKRGSTELEVIYADKSGVYLQEGHLALKSYFVIGATARESATLVKADKNLSEEFRNDFNRELKGKEFVQFFMLQDKMLIIASEYQRSSRTIVIHASEVNKKSGELMSSWKEVTSFQKDEKRDEINFKLTYNADSTKMIVVSSIEGRERNAYQIQEFNNTLKATSKPVNISNEFDSKTYKLEDLIYTSDSKILLVGRVYEFQEGKKKKDKFLDFLTYNIRLYNEDGSQRAEVNTNINGKWLTSTKVVQERGKDLVLAAFYNNKKKGKTIDGMLVQRINSNTGDVMSTSDKAINNSMLATDEDAGGDDEANNGEDDKESRAERKERERLDKLKDEGEAFSKYMQFRNIFYTPDNGLVILAEKAHHYTVMSQSYSGGGSNIGSGGWTTSYYSVDECGDLLMTKIDAAGNIAWLQILPKMQREVMRIGYNGGSAVYSFFDAVDRPLYAGFAAMQSNNSIQLIFNDHSRNENVTQPGQKVKTLRRFGKSESFLVSVDEATGKIKRQHFFNNADVPTSMPRKGVVIGNEMYIVGKDDKFTRAKIAVAKITVK